MDCGSSPQCAGPTAGRADRAGRVARHPHLGPFHRAPIEHLQPPGQRACPTPASSFSASAACMVPMMPTSGANTPIVAQRVSSNAGVGREHAGIAGRCRRRACRTPRSGRRSGSRRRTPAACRAATQAALTAWRVAKLSLQSSTTSASATSSSSSARVGALDAAARTCTLGIDAPRSPAARRLGLRLADARQVVRDLALQVGEVDRVVVDQRDAADAGRAEVQRHRRAQPAGADDQRMRGQQALLALDADLVEQDVARVAQQLVVGHGRDCRGKRKRPCGARAFVRRGSAEPRLSSSFVLGLALDLRSC